MGIIGPLVCGTHLIRRGAVYQKLDHCLAQYVAHSLQITEDPLDDATLRYNKRVAELLFPEKADADGLNMKRKRAAMDRLLDRVTGPFWARGLQHNER